jgi:hypothetical protein
MKEDLQDLMGNKAIVALSLLATAVAGLVIYKGATAPPDKKRK